MAAPFTRIQSEAIDAYGDSQAYDNYAKFDGVIWWLGQTGNIKIIKGGQPNFRERIMMGPNSNIAFRTAGGQIDQNDDEGFTLVSSPQRLISGSIVYNQQEVDQVRGNAALAVSLIDDKTEQFHSTYVQTVAHKLRQAAPGANDPLTLLPSAANEANGILSPQAVASQTGTTCGIPRSETYTDPSGASVRYWANQYSNTSFDLTSVAGQRGLYLNVYSKCIRGNGDGWAPDFGLVSDIVWSSMSAREDNLRRYKPNDKAVSVGFDNIRFHQATLFVDRSDRMLTGSLGKVAFLNSKALKLHVLEGTGGVTKEMLDARNNLKAVPIFWKHKGMSDYTTLKYNWVGYCTMNLVPKSLQDHGLADNCT